MAMETVPETQDMSEWWKRGTVGATIAVARSTAEVTPDGALRLNLAHCTLRG